MSPQLQLSGFADLDRAEAVRRVQDAVHEAGGRIHGARSPSSTAMAWVLELTQGSAAALESTLRAAGLRLTDESEALLRREAGSDGPETSIDAELTVLFVEATGRPAG